MEGKLDAPIESEADLYELICLHPELCQEPAEAVAVCEDNVTDDYEINLGFDFIEDEELDAPHYYRR
jgi:hypothetical protein